MKIVPKEWGKETWVLNEPEYCMKYLDIAPGKQCSLHFHPIKKETFIVQDGTVTAQLGHEVMELGYHERLTVEPGTPHRFASEWGARIIEISTHHDDADVVKLEPSGDFKLKEWFS